MNQSVENSMKPVKVLFVCMGNICRSPTAHGVFQHMVNQAELNKKIIIESAGTIGYHAGERPDSRATVTARSNGIDLSKLIARKVNDNDYSHQDFILGMDYSNLRNMNEQCPDKHQHKLGLLLSYHPDENLQEVPDPYYGGDNGFDNVFTMVEVACRHLLEHIKQAKDL